MKLTFEEWLQIWVDSGHLHERGRKRGQYVMSRVNDLGSYEVGNVFIQTGKQNNRDCWDRPGFRDAHKTGFTSTEFKILRGALSRDRNSKPCTFDGVMIYPSLKALTSVHGHGKGGGKHPNFRYLTPEEVKRWKQGN